MIIHYKNSEEMCIISCPYPDVSLGYNFIGFQSEFVME